jgi:hypothetical protein
MKKFFKNLPIIILGSLCKLSWNILPVLGNIIRRFKRKRGCLYGKTEQEKIDFFKLLSSFAIKDKQFFIEQCEDLLPKEIDEFIDWVIKNNEGVKLTIVGIDIIQKLVYAMKNEKV